MRRLAVALLLGFLGLLAPARGQEVDEEALFALLEPHMSVTGLRLEEATLEVAMRRLGQVDRKDQLQGPNGTYVCYAAPDGARLGLSFATSQGLLVLRRFELAGGEARLENAPVAAGARSDRPPCRPVKVLVAATGGWLRLGMSRAEVTSLLGRETGGAGGDSWRYSASLTRELSAAQREVLAEAGVMIQTDFVVERELRLEFRGDRLVAIRARQATRG